MLAAENMHVGGGTHVGAAALGRPQSLSSHARQLPRQFQ